MGRDTLGRPRHRLEQYVKMNSERGEGTPRTGMPEERERKEEEKKKKKKKKKKEEEEEAEEGRTCGVHSIGGWVFLYKICKYLQGKIEHPFKMFFAPCIAIQSRNINQQNARLLN
jgi:hypothetical protein